MIDPIVYGDVEWAVAQEIGARASLFGYPLKPFAGSTDASLSGDSVQCVRVGGQEIQPAVSAVLVDLDVRATSEARAVLLGDIVQAVAVAAGSEQFERDGVQVVSSRIVSLPYLLPDPQHPTLHRVVAKIEFILKGRALN